MVVGTWRLRVSQSLQHTAQDCDAISKSRKELSQRIQYYIVLHYMYIILHYMMCILYIYIYIHSLYYIYIYTYINIIVDDQVVLHLKSRSVTSFLLEKNSMAPAHSLVAAWPFLPRMTHTNPLALLSWLKKNRSGAAHWRGTCASTGYEPKVANLGRFSLLSCWHGHEASQPGHGKRPE